MRKKVDIYFLFFVYKGGANMKTINLNLSEIEEERLLELLEEIDDNTSLNIDFDEVKDGEA